MSTKRQTENNILISSYIRPILFVLFHFFRAFRRVIIFPLTLLLLPSLVSAYQIEAGGNHTCALDDNGAICWGYNDFGQINVPELSNPRQISAGKNHTCSIDDSDVKCWGWNTYGQITVPVLSNPTQVSSGDKHTCALDDSGVKCWGDNAFGQNNEPVLSNPTRIGAGANHTCAIDDSGVVCWGWDAFGLKAVPEQVANPIQITAGYSHTCILDDIEGIGSTRALCWGRDEHGQSTVPALSNPTQISAGANHTCALDDSGVVCWGWNGYGQSSVPALSNPTQITAGFGHTCALDDSGVVCWGWDSSGQSTADNSLSFTAVNGSCGESHDKVFTSIPTENLCASGLSSDIAGTDPWTWSCTGAYGGSNASCSTRAAVQEPAINGSCGESHDKVFTSIPAENLCAAGLSSDIAGTDPWTWSCTGAYGGSDASCSARTAVQEPAINGSCGESHDKVFTSIPTENLCAAGLSSDIAGTDPWAWSCAGINGGRDASCSTIRTEQEENQITFIERFYHNILNRASDSDGMDHWLNVIQNESGANVAFGFFNSQEFKSLILDNTAFINILYQTLFGRESDQAGFDYWMTQLEAGTLRETVIQGFVRSQEFEDLASSFGVIALNDNDNALFQIESFIERFYQLVLDRNPDIDGFNHWLAQLTNLNSPQSAGDIARGFFQSPEFVNRLTTDSEFLDIAYRSFFDRESDAEGKQYWLAELSAGASRLEVVNGFIGSEEFIALANQFGIRTS